MSGNFTAYRKTSDAAPAANAKFFAGRRLVEEGAQTADASVLTTRRLNRLPYRVSVNANGGTVSVDHVDGYIAEKIGTLPTPSFGDKRFAGWFTAATGGTEVTADTLVYSDTPTIYAHWADPVTLTFNPNGGTISGAQTITVYKGFPIGSSGTALPTATPASSTHTYLGWYTSTSGWTNVNADTIYDGSYTVVYAKYEEMTTTISVTTSSSYKKAGVYSATRYSTATPIVIAWGDGAVDLVNGNVSQLVHEYKTVGSFTIGINNNITAFALSYNNSTWYGTTTNNRYIIYGIPKISSRVTSIPSYAFYYCQYLGGTVTIPDSVTGLGDRAFYYCFYYSSRSGSVIIGNGVTIIPSYCFYYCYYLSGVTIGSKVASIATYAFAYCRYKLSSIDIPATVTSIGTYAFSYCYYLASITCRSSTAPTVQSTTFGNSSTYYTGRASYSSGTNRLHVPSGATGYTSSYWQSVLLDSTKCGFTKVEDI